MFGGGAYILSALRLWGPAISMINAASAEGINIGKAKLREFLEENEESRQALASNGKETRYISLDQLDSFGKRIEDNDERT